MTRALRYLLLAVLAALSQFAHSQNINKGNYPDWNGCASAIGYYTYSCSGGSNTYSNPAKFGITLETNQKVLGKEHLGGAAAGCYDGVWYCTYYQSGGCPSDKDAVSTSTGTQCLPKCQVDETRNPETHECESPQPPTCDPGQHVEYNQCVPDNCPSSQAWDSTKQSCYPTTPPPDTSQPAPSTYLPGGSYDPNNPDQPTQPLPGLSTGIPANCGGWKCTYRTGNYDPNGGCYRYESSPGVTHCSFTPTYDKDANGNPIPYVGEPTNEPPSYTAPPPVNSENPPPITCPVNYHYSYVSGICITDSSPGTPPTLEGPGGQPTPGTGSCPLGYVQQPDGRCTATAPTTYCPFGYYPVNGYCVSNGTYDPTTGTPGPVGGTGNGGGTCGGPGQPPCKIDLGGPGDIEGPQLFELPEFEFDLSTLQPVDLGGPAAQCPPDVQLPRGLVWSWETTCSFAEWMRPIFLGMAWLFAGFIVLSGIPRD